MDPWIDPLVWLSLDLEGHNCLGCCQNGSVLMQKLTMKSIVAIVRSQSSCIRILSKSCMRMVRSDSFSVMFRNCRAARRFCVDTCSVVGVDTICTKSRLKVFLLPRRKNGLELKT